jgi:hypothetical protein
MTGFEEVYLKNISKLKNEIKLLRKEYNQLSTDSEQARAFHADHKGISCESIYQNSEKLHSEILQLKHLRKMDLEFLCILVWGYGIDKHKYNSMDKRIYSGYSTYLKRAYDWDWLVEFVNEDETDAIFDRIELINNEVRRDKEEAIKRVKREEDWEGMNEKSKTI